MGCGADHASFAVAPVAASVTAFDLSPEMLAVVGAAAQQRGLHNLATEQGNAASLPFADAAFDMVVTRFRRTTGSTCRPRCAKSDACSRPMAC